MWTANRRNGPPPREGRRCRKSKHTQARGLVKPDKPSFLFQLPLSILTRVLDLLLPIDILSLSRVCTALRRGLSRDGCLWGKWAEARDRFAIARMPDPPEGVCEIEWAAFVFDGGKCQVSPVPLIRSVSCFPDAHFPRSAVSGRGFGTGVSPAYGIVAEYVITVHCRKP